MTMTKRIEAMRGLGPNWDSYGADAPDPRTLAIAQDFFTRLIATSDLREPQVVPSRIGGICALWAMNGCELEVGVEREGETVLIDYLFESKRGNEVVEGRFQYSASEYVLPRTLHTLTKQMVDNGNRVAV
jgi:hypothetical protein